MREGSREAEDEGWTAGVLGMSPRVEGMCMNNIDSDIYERQIEWANLKCRCAAYTGSIPEWTRDVLVPSEKQMSQLIIYVSHRVQDSAFRQLFYRTPRGTAHPTA